MSNAPSSFAREMEHAYRLAAERGYRATYFLRMIRELGPLEAAHRLLADDKVHEGLMKLWELGLLHISVEAIVLKPEFASLFSDEERARARRRLHDLDYTPPWLRGEV